MKSRTDEHGPAGQHSQDVDGAAPPDHEIDITAETCPMTFVRTRLALDRMAAGQTLRVRLRGEEPASNVPRMADSLGHAVLRVGPGPDGVTSVLIRKGAAPPAG